VALQLLWAKWGTLMRDARLELMAPFTTYVPLIYGVLCRVCLSTITQKYPGFADRIHEGLVDIFGERGRSVLAFILAFKHLSHQFFFLG
jgi:hypothetical protein